MVLFFILCYSHLECHDLDRTSFTLSSITKSVYYLCLEDLRFVGRRGYPTCPPLLLPEGLRLRSRGLGSTTDSRIRPSPPRDLGVRRRTHRDSTFVVCLDRRRNRGRGWKRGVYGRGFRVRSCPLFLSSSFLTNRVVDHVLAGLVGGEREVLSLSGTGSPSLDGVV